MTEGGEVPQSEDKELESPPSSGRPSYARSKSHHVEQLDRVPSGVLLRHSEPVLKVQKQSVTDMVRGPCSLLCLRR